MSAGLLFFLLAAIAVLAMGVREAVLFFRWTRHVRRVRSTQYRVGDRIALSREDLHPRP